MGLFECLGRLTLWSRPAVNLRGGPWSIHMWAHRNDCGTHCPPAPSCCRKDGTCQFKKTGGEERYGEKAEHLVLQRGRPQSHVRTVTSDPASRHCPLAGRQPLAPVHPSPAANHAPPRSPRPASKPPSPSRTLALAPCALSLLPPHPLSDADGRCSRISKPAACASATGRRNPPGPRRITVVRHGTFPRPASAPPA